MTIRTNENLVREVIDTDPNMDMSVFLQAASALVDRLEEVATGNSQTVTAVLLKNIETYLAAHLYAIRDQQPTQSSTQKAEMSFQGKWGFGLNHTSWGQVAVTLDWTGFLADLTSEGGNQQTILTWAGTTRT